MVSQMSLKRSAKWDPKYLFVIFKNILTTSRLPVDWKLTIVKHIDISRDPHQAGNYRRVFLTWISCKSFKHIIAKHIVQYFTEDKLLSNLKKKHGFRTGFSTQLVETVHTFSSIINRRGQVDVSTLTFPKPLVKFLTQSSWRAMLKNHQIVNWIGDFLMKRGQYVMFNQPASYIANVESETPPGSVLGSLLLLL